jgi:hypothetical protein
LLEISAAYVIQRAWRAALQKRIRARKVRTKNLAAVKIQAAWKGYWVRSRKFQFIDDQIHHCDSLMVKLYFLWQYEEICMHAILF